MHSYLVVVHKLRLQEEGVGSPKMLTFCKLSWGRKCQRRGVGCPEIPKFYQRSLWTTPKKEKCIQTSFNGAKGCVKDDIIRVFSDFLNKHLKKRTVFGYFDDIFGS